MVEVLLRAQQYARCLLAGFEEGDPGLVEAELHVETGPLVEGDRLAEIADGEQHVVEAEQLKLK